jgi:hypothetical protein
MLMTLRAILVVCLVCVTASCGTSNSGDRFGDAAPKTVDGGVTDATTGPGALGGTDADTSCASQCSIDYRDVIDCHGNIAVKCGDGEACDPSTLKCNNACDVASSNKQSIGCDYYSVLLKQQSEGRCFAAIVSNTWKAPAKLVVDYDGVSLNPSLFAWHPKGSGPSLTYSPYDANVGIPAGDVAILFLSGTTGSANAQCPKNSAVMSGVSRAGTNKGEGFHIRTDVPVVAYQINPYGGGAAAVTGSSLLLPTSAWDTNYIAVNAAGSTSAGKATLNIIAHQDNTTVEMLPVKAILAGTGLPAGAQGAKYTFALNAGEHAQFVQANELTGSVVKSTKPVGLFAGHECMNVPSTVSYCDHGEQMIPPVQAMGSEYVGVMYRPRKTEPAIWRLIGAMPGTQLTWSSNVGGPATLNAGQVVEFETAEPFVVKAQDSSHPFLLLTYMSGSDWKPGMSGHGDPEVVLSVPPQQYLSRYVFFADPTYPEGNLVVVRKKNGAGQFAEVSLDCAGKLAGWQAIGDYEWTRTDLITGAFQNVGTCSSGRHEMTSTAPFGLWVWGWGTPLTSTFTSNVSYGYPAGMNVQPINQLVIEPVPR